MQKMTHIDADGNARMVDVGGKEITERVAIAEGHIELSEDAFRAVVERTAKKGDVLAIAQLAGIMGAKRTADLIPLCHPLPLSGINLELRTDPGKVVARATVRTVGRTGVEMEALTAVSVALLTVYDMLKAEDRAMVIGAVRLLEKDGGRSGHWVREQG